MAIPKLPKHTCPMIDRLKNAIERAFKMADGEYPDDEESLKSLLRDIRHELLGEADALEDIRSANAQLRECAEGYMMRCEELESEIAAQPQQRNEVGMNTEYKLYAERDIMQLDKAGNYYCKHLMAMTAEGLHSKSDIAAELAYRDSVIAELEGQLANREVLCLPAEELKELIYSIHGSHHVGDAQHTKLDIINAQIDSLYANREPFVVKMPLSISVLISDGLHADFMLNSEIKAAITAAGGRCVNMIESVSTQLPPPMLTANEIMQRVQAMLEPIILTHYNERNANEDKVLADFVQLKRDVWGSSDG